MFRGPCFWPGLFHHFPAFCPCFFWSGCYSSAVLLLLCWSWSLSLWLSSSGQVSGSPPALEDGPGVARSGAVCIWIGLLQYGQNMTAAAVSVWPCLWSWFHAARAASGRGCKMIHAGRARAAAILSILASCAAPVDCLYNVWRVMFSRSARSANVRPRALQSVLIFSFKSMWANVAYLYDFCKLSPGLVSAVLGPGPVWISGQLSGLQIFLGL